MFIRIQISRYIPSFVFVAPLIFPLSRHSLICFCNSAPAGTLPWLELYPRLETILLSEVKYGYDIMTNPWKLYASNTDIEKKIVSPYLAWMLCYFYLPTRPLFCMWE